jgi:hypothetical protein
MRLFSDYSRCNTALWRGRGSSGCGLALCRSRWSEVRIVLGFALRLVFWLWRPIGGVLWRIDDAIAETIAAALYAAGLLIVLISTFLINHFDLLGLRQVYLYLAGRP